MTHLTSPIQAGEPLNREECREVRRAPATKAPRVKRHYQAELAALQNRVDTVNKLLPCIKVEKSSQETFNAIMVLLRGE